MNLQVGREIMRTHRNEGEAIRTVMEVKLKILVNPRAMNPVKCFSARPDPKDLLGTRIMEWDFRHPNWRWCGTIRIKQLTQIVSMPGLVSPIGELRLDQQPHDRTAFVAEWSTVNHTKFALVEKELRLPRQSNRLIRLGLS